MSDRKPAVLTVAGSDSGGGAGIQTDLRTFHAFHVYGCCAVTAVTAQNPDEVRRVDMLPAGAVRSQLETVLDVFPVRWAKTGMLGSRETVKCVAETVAKYNLQLVVDPVMVSTSGTKLLEDPAISAMQEWLLPLAAWITPNIPEAELLCGRKLSTPEDLAEAAQMLYRQYHCHVILKSGHAIRGGEVTDMVCYGGELHALSSPRADISGNTAHGTGCTLSAALAANFAAGKCWQDVLRTAKAFVYGALCEKVQLSDTLFQMYPPEKNRLDQIRLEAL